MKPWKGINLSSNSRSALDAGVGWDSWFSHIIIRRYSRYLLVRRFWDCSVGVRSRHPIISFETRFPTFYIRSTGVWLRVSYYLAIRSGVLTALIQDIGAGNPIGGLLLRTISGGGKVFHPSEAYQNKHGRSRGFPGQGD